MADVFRRGAKDVHRSIRDGGARFDVNPCNLDPGGAWSPAIPPGPRCPVCFAGRVQSRKRNGRLASAAGGAGALALVASVFTGGANGDPVMSFYASGPSGSVFASVTISGQSLTPTVMPTSVTPEPSSDPTATPALTPRPSFDNLGPRMTPTSEPTARPTNTPEPTCGHPGGHLGLDEQHVCRWWEKHR